MTIKITTPTPHKGCILQPITFKLTPIKGVFLGGCIMSVAIKLSDNLAHEAKLHAAVSHRSVPKQIEYWSRIGKLAEENPDMPFRFIQETLLSLEESKDPTQVSEYQFG